MYRTGKGSMSNGRKVVGFYRVGTARSCALWEGGKGVGVVRKSGHGCGDSKAKE